jgi:(p)ppGpp synthase/HD superfamily hydrolase
MKLTDRFEQALVYAVRLHGKQMRKGTQIPYTVHLLSVAALVLENGGDEDQAIAGLLHDAVEDQGGLPRLEEIQKLYGEKVAIIVDGCTDAYHIPKAPWQQRKELYLKRLQSATPDVRLVSLADKVHNARSLLASLYQEGNSAWSRFNGGKTGTLWYYKNLVQVFQQTGYDYLTVELAKVVSEIESWIEK